MSTQQQTRRMCHEQVFKDYRDYQCTRTASVERDGKWFCKQHDPVAVKERQEARSKAWNEKYNAEEKARKDRQHKINCHDTLLAALESLTAALAINGTKEERAGREEAIQAAWEQGIAAIALVEDAQKEEGE